MTAVDDEACSYCPDMVLVQPGAFDMGRDGGEPNRYDGPVRSVTLSKPIWVSTTEVTNRDYDVFVEETGYQPASSCNVFYEGKWGLQDWADWQNPGLGIPLLPEHPAVCLSWHDSVAYTGWLAEKTGEPYRLLTEAEWEFVARAGSQTEFAWGESADAGCNVANMFDVEARAALPDMPWDNSNCSDGYAMVSPVASLEPNSLGLYDILGNVWEWTQDCYVLPYPDLPVDGSSVEVEGECERRTVRGGSWETRPSRLAPAFRGRDNPAQGFRTFGFRLARDAG